MGSSTIKINNEFKRGVFVGKYDVLDISEYILNFCENKFNNPITNSKLQRILYKIWDKYQREYEELLFDNEVCLWERGYVVPDAYYEYRHYTYKPITKVVPKYEDLFEKWEEEFIESICIKNL
jgi:uncharacterized phage-associated protein